MPSTLPPPAGASRRSHGPPPPRLSAAALGGAAAPGTTLVTSLIMASKTYVFCTLFIIYIPMLTFICIYMYDMFHQ